MASPRAFKLPNKVKHPRKKCKKCTYKGPRPISHTKEMLCKTFLKVQNLTLMFLHVARVSGTRTATKSRRKTSLLNMLFTVWMYICYRSMWLRWKDFNFFNFCFVRRWEFYSASQPGCVIIHMACLFDSF
jgi:hypothetical protein